MDQVIISATDNEQQNREFVRLTPKMQPPLGAFRFDYKGYFGTVIATAHWRFTETL